MLRFAVKGEGNFAEKFWLKSKCYGNSWWIGEKFFHVRFPATVLDRQVEIRFSLHSHLPILRLINFAKCEKRDSIENQITLIGSICMNVDASAMEKI